MPLVTLTIASVLIIVSSQKSLRDINMAVMSDDHRRIAHIGISANNKSPVRDPSSMSQLSFSPWMQEYISFHQSKIVNGRLKDDARYLIYQCKDGDIRCGGAGDRMLAMVKMLYLAMCTRRVLLIDSTFPIPLEAVLNPAHVEWNATFPETVDVFDDLNLDAPLDLRSDVRGYRIARTNGNTPRIKKSFNDIWSKFFLAEHLKNVSDDIDKENWINLAKKKSIADAIHEAFWTLFKFDTTVVARAHDLKASAGLSEPYYMGLHMRSGDENMGVEVRLDRKMERATKSDDLLKCYNFVRDKYPSVASAYLASDNMDLKEMMSTKDPSIHYANLRPFHIDLLARNESHKQAKYSVADMSVFQGVVDAWAEILVLSESSFLILSRSMFSFAAHYIRNPQACDVYLDQCLLAATGEGKIVYYGEVIIGDLSLILSTRCIQ
jgi:hypothetical protein